MVMKPAKGRACGKFILLGEHFVVPHETTPAVPALAFPLRELWCEVKVSSSSHPRYHAELPVETDYEEVESLMARATYAAASSLRLDVSGQPLKVESSANFPISRGFGSSGSFAVALVRALDEFRKQLIGESADWHELVKATSAVEQIFHGRPSGVDTATILSERPIRFHDGKVVRELDNRAVDFVVVDSGSRDNCAALVKEVIAFRERNREQWGRMAGVLGGLVDDTETAMAKGDAPGVAKAVRAAHGILAELGLSNPGIEAIIREATDAGALGGKVSGAGGGGAVLLVANRGDGQKIAQAMRDTGRAVVGMATAGEGARRGG